MPDIELALPAGRRPGYLAVPVPTSDRPGPWPGVVMVHDVFGLGNDLREQADWLAAAGYVVLAPDLYQGKAAVRCLQGTFRQLAARSGPHFDAIDATRRQLIGRSDCDGNVGIIGYCMGGAFALLMAGRPGFTAASINYGFLPDNLEEVLSAPCPIVASYGAKDRALKGAAPRLEKALTAVGVAHDVHEYPHAGHAFINRVAAASPLATLLKVSGAGYHHPSAEDAKRRILAFFDKHLRVGAAD